MPSILVVDDEPGVRSSISGVLRDEGFDVDTADTGEDCLEKANGAALRRHRAGYLAARP